MVFFGWEKGLKNHTGKTIPGNFSVPFSNNFCSFILRSFSGQKKTENHAFSLINFGVKNETFLTEWAIKCDKNETEWAIRSTFVSP